MNKAPIDVVSPATFGSHTGSVATTRLVSEEGVACSNDYRDLRFLLRWPLVCWPAASSARGWWFGIKRRPVPEACGWKGTTAHTGTGIRGIGSARAESAIELRVD